MLRMLFAALANAICYTASQWRPLIERGEVNVRKAFVNNERYLNLNDGADFEQHS